MSAAFDPYHEWLSIPPDEQPPDHYRLLGLKQFESKANVIENAADRQMAHVRSFQSGTRAELTQKLLNEIAAAKIVLLDDEKKAAYDGELKARLAKKKRSGQPLPVAEALPEQPQSSPATVEITAAATASPSVARRPSRGGSPAMLYGIVAVAGVLLLMLGGGVVLALYAAGVFSPQAVAEATDNTDVDNPGNNAAANSHDDETGDELPAASLPEDDPLDPPPNTGGNNPGPSDKPAPDPPVDNNGNDNVIPVANPATADDPLVDEPDNTPPVDVAPPTDPPQDVAEPAPAPKKNPVPAKAARDAKRKEIESIFPIADARTFEAKGDLAAQLIRTGRQTNNDLVAQFALFNLAREIAAEAGQIKLAFESIDELSATFEFDPDAIRVASIDAAIRAKLPPAAKREIITTGSTMLDGFLADDRYPEAEALLDRLLGVARSLRDAELIKQLADQRRTVDDLSANFAKAKAAFAALEKYPDDPAANLAAGRYLIFAKHDWEKGLPHLAKGSDQLLSAAAKADLADPQTTDDEVKTADAWWDAAAEESDVNSRLCLARAAMWYRKAGPSLAGLAAAKANARIKDVTERGIDIQLAKTGRVTLPAVSTDSPDSPDERPAKPDRSPIQPGLVTRIYQGQPFKTPTPILVITESSDDFSKARDLVPEELRAAFRGTGKWDPQPVSQGFIYLDKQAEVSFTLSNANCKLNGSQINKSNGTREFTMVLPVGLHPISIHRQDHGRSAPRFKITRSDTGDNVLVHRRDQLQIELSKPVNVVGTLVASRLIGAEVVDSDDREDQPSAIGPSKLPETVAPTSSLVVCEALQAKTSPKGLTDGAVAFSGPRGDGRSGANGIVLDASQDWAKKGTEWACRYRRGGSARGIQFIHPLARGHVIVTVSEGNVIAASVARWPDRGYTGGTGSIPLVKAPAFAQKFKLGEEPHHLTSRVMANGAWGFYVDGELMAVGQFNSALPLDLTDAFKGDGFSPQLSVGQAGVIIGPQDGGINRAEGVRFGVIGAAAAKTARGDTTPVRVVASGSNNNTVYLNGKLLLNCRREKATVVSAAIKPGDVICVRLGDRFDIMSHWMMFLSDKDEYLFETSEAWTGYLPADKERWWESAGENLNREPAKSTSNREYVNLVKASAAAAVPNHKAADPIYSPLMGDNKYGQAYLTYTVKAEDLLPKKADGSATSSSTNGDSDKLLVKPEKAKAVDLLALIDLKQDTVSGDWQINDGHVVSSEGTFSRIRVPYIPPDEYRIDMEVEVPQKGHKSLMFGLIRDGRRFAITIDVSNGPTTGLTMVDGKGYENNETSSRGDVLARDRINRVSYVVTKEAIQMACNGRKIIDWRGASSRLSLWPDWEIPDKHCLILGTQYSRHVVHSLTLTPISGEGQPARN